MKRWIAVLIAIMMMLSAVVGILGCGEDDNNNKPPYGDTEPIVPGDDDDDPGDDDDDPGDDDDGPGDDETVRVVYLKVSNAIDTVHTMTKSTTAGETYSIRVSLAVGDRVTIYDNSSVTYGSYSDPEFTGNITRAGEYTFALRIDGTSGTIYVTVPQTPTPTPTPTPDDPEPEPEVPRNTNVTVYYTNTNKWSNVYAYVWNSSTQKVKATWPGTKLSSIGDSGYGETQHSIAVDYSVYDRIIFNDGGSNQTKDLIVGGATSGYFGVDEMFTYGSDDYGKVQYFTLKDTTNLSYKSGASKKFSVYTPRGYTSSKKYGVLYMFDSQNLYIAANGAEPNHDSYGSWAVDVAVNNLVKNGSNGVIIVAIDNTDGYRNQELTMNHNTFGPLTSLADEDNYYNGKLDELGNFIKYTLKPWIESKYSVDTRREKTGIAGSSSGGLAAYYLGLRDNDLYGYIGAFSPANGLFKSSDWNKFYSSKSFGSAKPKIYVYCGENGDYLEKMLLPATKEIKNITNYGYSAADITENYVNGGTHSENYWRIAFTEFLSKYAW